MITFHILDEVFVRLKVKAVKVYAMPSLIRHGADDDATKNLIP